MGPAQYMVTAGEAGAGGRTGAQPASSLGQVQKNAYLCVRLFSSP